ncbi:LuxR C-terminal-related transcriptional regulator [Hyphococcus luteus]|uniref:HTH luxR-type domain-containing protein n=1 Tax=Hyphococcus luteus TaxID=2058213 RepID=A0A2S7K5K9_9PROT|nr:LuxR C-terminal-related transcriptional regulator [Marinicaulis flavus]PQA87790.1 hypothetical protein CW354_05375 [Marinicaulis flavus]
MRRSTQSETSHGTAAGQMPIDVRLVDEHGLTRREAECATLLRYGVAAAELPERLGVTKSTMRKHLSGLREKIGVKTTQDLIVFLMKAAADDNIAAYHSWPPVSVAPLKDFAAVTLRYGDLAEDCRGKLQLIEMLAVLRDHLEAEFGARYVFYSYSPLSVYSLLRDDVLRVTLAPPQIVEALHAAGPTLDSPSARQLFAKPDGIAFVDGRSDHYEEASPGVQAFYDVCLQDGVRYGVSFGFPSGGAFVGVSVSLDESVADAQKLVAERGEEMRAAAMVMHNCAWTYGALAAAYGLTIRERDALSLLAQGRRAAEAAELMKMSERALGYLLIGARQKLSAETNAEAVCKAAAANILVFR